MRIPRSIKIASRRYKVFKRTPPSPAEIDPDGLINFGTPGWGKPWRIFIEPGQDELRQATVFLHEVIHGVNMHYLNDTLEENEVSGLTEGLMQVIRDGGLDFNG